MPKQRLEKDSLGKIEVPADALYGAQTARARANFPVSGRMVSPALLRAFLRVKSAAALANEKCGVLEPENAALIRRAVDELLSLDHGKWQEAFVLDVFQAGAGTSTHMNVNEVVANVANRLAGHPL